MGLNEVIQVEPDPMGLVSLEKETTESSHALSLPFGHQAPRTGWVRAQRWQLPAAGKEALDKI